MLEMNIMKGWVQKVTLQKAALDEIKIRSLLERWVSGCDPAIAMDENFNILGLTDADTLLGMKGFILA